jgi:hypothetical protein
VNKQFHLFAGTTTRRDIAQDFASKEEAIKEATIYFARACAAGLKNYEVWVTEPSNNQWIYGAAIRPKGFVVDGRYKSGLRPLKRSLRMGKPK